MRPACSSIPMARLASAAGALALAALLAGGCGGGGGGGPADAGADALADAEAPEDAAEAPDAEDAAPEVEDAAPDLPPCEAVPPPEALLAAGQHPGGLNLALGGREIAPAGPTVTLPGFPASVAVHPSGAWAYVHSTSRDDRRVLVVDLATLEVLQDVNQGEGFHDVVVSPAGDRVYAAGGASGRVEVYAVKDDGTLTPDGSVTTDGWPSGLALSPDGATLWVGLFKALGVAEIDTATLAETRRLELEHDVYSLLLLPGHGQLYAADLATRDLSVVDLATGAPIVRLDVPTSPAGMVASPDEARVWVAVSGADAVAALDPALPDVVGWELAVGPDLAGPDGAPLLNSNVNALAYDPEAGRLYAARGADNAVAVLDAETLGYLGAFPAAWYPTDLALIPGEGQLVVVDGKGGGVGPNDGQGAKERSRGSLTRVDLGALDLAEATARATAAYRRPSEVFPFACEGDFPIPSRPGQVSPIEHVVLVVKENKTFDCLFGDMEDLDADRDPSLVRWGAELIPNQRALARAFAISDNFYTEAPNSDTGHLFLTNAHLTEFIERVWLDSSKGNAFLGYQLGEPAVPEVGNFFTHLLERGVGLRIYGEIVGMFVESEETDALPIDFSDPAYPGGPFTNYAEPDENKARYIAERVAAGELAPFTFVLFPNDHTVGTVPGEPTPESMVADNDYAVGILVDALSHSPFWPKTAIFILQDDPQGCEDHVDALRSFLLVVSPWAKRGYVSHVNASFASVFATMTRILGVPPLGRPDGSASPVWDMFTATPDFTPYVASPRLLPPEVSPEDAPGAKASAAMDFRSPDRNPDLAVVLDAYRLWKMGRISREEADRRIAERVIDPERLEALEEEAEEERFAFDRDFARYQRWLARRQAAGAAAAPAAE